jgi:hypothetical protein
MIRFSVVQRRLGLLFGASLAAAALAGPSSAFALALDVNVVNKAANPVPVAIQGTPTVALSPSGNTVKVDSSAAAPVIVQPAREPFQQFVAVSSAGTEACDPVVVPDGKRLAIESFSAEVTGNARVYIRTAARRPGTSNLLRTLRVPLTPAGSDYAGTIQTLLHTGATSDPNGWTFEAAACIATSGGGNVTLRGIVSGYLEAASS